MIELPLISWIPRLLIAGWDALKQPKIRDPRAPANLLEHSQPYSSLAHLKDLFGNPARSDKQWITFKFRDAFLQVRSEDGLTISSVDVLLRRPRRLTTLAVYPLPYALGRVRLSDVLEKDSRIEYDRSSKFFCFYIKRYFGNPGKYLYYTFGLYCGAGIREPAFEWDFERNVLLSHPANVRLNWIGIDASDKPRFSPNFYHFI